MKQDNNGIEKSPTNKAYNNPGSGHKMLEIFIGKWITSGIKFETPSSSEVNIEATDVYEWAPGGFFLIHTAYGRIGDQDVGGVEIIGYDQDSNTYDSHLFDSQDNIIISELTLSQGIWTWLGATPFEENGTQEIHRATVEFIEDGKTMNAYHEQSEDGINWTPSMDVILTKVE